MSILQVCRQVACCGFVVSSLLSAGPLAVSADTTAIEEDWQLDLLTPNAIRSSPQLNCLIASTGNTASYYAVLLINQRATLGGGMVLQLWEGTSLLDSSELSLYQSLATPNERINWTTRMELSSNGVLTVQILSGTSTTWGKFGGKTELLVSTQTSLQNLNSYSPDASTSSSGVEFGHPRVSKLMLRKVRVYMSNKKSVEQALDRVVFQYK